MRERRRENGAQASLISQTRPRATLGRATELADPPQSAVEE
jgi:hypothetical protein